MLASDDTAKSGELSRAYPLHWLVWHNHFRELLAELESAKHDIEKVDPRGRTALHLAVALDHLECTSALLRHGANANAENASNWTVTHEAVSSGDPELLQRVLQYRDYQRYLARTRGVPRLLKALSEAPDFYIEMKWEFTSWVPLVSRMCPKDTYKVWKSGSRVRIDTTLLGFDNNKWETGSRSYVFVGEGNKASIMEIDHDARLVYTESMRDVSIATPDLDLLLPTEAQVSARLTSPIVTSYLNTDRIEFERNKTGLWGWRSDKTEAVNSYECKVFSASNVEFITKSRTEHLSDQDKQKKKRAVTVTPLESFLGIAEQLGTVHGTTSGVVSDDIHNPCSITALEYFDTNVNLGDRDIGRPIEQTAKMQKFKCTLSLSESYPLSLPEQVLPIIDLMAVNNAHFRKLKDFITLQLPSGFPVKIEIPIFHILTAKITFGNIYGLDKPISGVTAVGDAKDGPVSCIVEDSVFEPPPNYRRIGEGHHEERRTYDDDDELLQFAIQQSIFDNGPSSEQPDVIDPSQLPALPSLPTEQRTSSHPSLHAHRTQAFTGAELAADFDMQLQLALAMSENESEEVQQRRHDLEREEEEQLRRILELSLTEK